MTERVALPPPPQDGLRRSWAVYLSLAESVGIASLCADHEAGVDLTGTLTMLLKVQEIKTQQGILPQLMLDVIDDPVLARGREGAAAMVHVRRFFANLKK